MTPGDLSAPALAAHAAAFLLAFGLCLALARRGHARKAWWLPGGLFAMTLLFVLMGTTLSGEMPTGLAAAGVLVTLGMSGVLGGALGILLGRPRT